MTSDLERTLETGGALSQLREEIGNGLGYQAFPEWFQDWALKEAEATTLRWFEPLVVPGLLQTEDYARAIFRTRFRITSEEIDEQVAARMKRQEILTRERPPAFWMILDEWVLRRPVGGSHVMLEQLTRLVEAARQRSRPGSGGSSPTGSRPGRWRWADGAAASREPDGDVQAAGGHRDRAHGAAVRRADR